MSPEERTELIKIGVYVVAGIAIVVAADLFSRALAAWLFGDDDGGGGGDEDHPTLSPNGNGNERARESVVWEAVTT